jgi:hypothetical protein
MARTIAAKIVHSIGLIIFAGCYLYTWVNRPGNDSLASHEQAPTPDLHEEREQRAGWMAAGCVPEVRLLNLGRTFTL